MVIALGAIAMVLFIGLIALATMVTGEPASQPVTKHYEMQGRF
jgi:hypothetical protein